MKRRTVTNRQLEQEPAAVWNTFINLIAHEEYDSLAPEQRPAHLVFWYETEVQNGGHQQFFENCGSERLSETIDSLARLRATCHQRVLTDAADKWLADVRSPIQTAEEFCEIALDDEFGEFDARFHKCEPDLMHFLLVHLQQNQDKFIAVE
jgi:hypothetical protein